MAKLKNCKHCGKEIAKSAKVCPNCGGKLGKPIFIKLICLIVGVILIIVGCSKIFSDAVDEVKNEYNDINGKTSFKTGDTFENKHLKVKFNSYNNDFKKYNEYLGPKNGYRIVEFDLTATNVGDDEEDFSYWDFDCYADDKSMDQWYFAEDEGLTNTLSKGKSADQKIYCEVPKDAKKIVIEYKALASLADKSVEFIGN